MLEREAFLTLIFEHYNNAKTRRVICQRDIEGNIFFLRFQTEVFIFNEKNRTCRGGGFVTWALRAVYDLLLTAAISAQGPGELSGDKTNDRWLFTPKYASDKHTCHVHGQRASHCCRRCVKSVGLSITRVATWTFLSNLFAKTCGFPRYESLNTWCTI